MKSVLQLLAVVPLLVAFSVGQNVKCRTALGSRPGPARIPTHTTTIVNPRRPTKTSVIHKISTRTLSKTSTVTLIVTATVTTTLPTTSLTFSSTSTMYPVETDTITMTNMETETVTSATSSTSTTVVVTTQGFQAVRDTINRNPPAKRDLISNPHVRAVPARAPAKKNGLAALSYVQQVDCTRTLSNKNTVTVRSTSMPIPTKTVHYFRSTTTDFRTVTTTTTIVPAKVSITVYVTETTTLTNFALTFATETTTTTTTTTSKIPGPTVYNACNAYNTFGAGFTSGGQTYYISDIHNNGVGVDSNYKAYADGASTALDCCNACFASGACENFSFRARSQNCFLLFHQGETCKSQNQHPNFFISKQGSDSNTGFVVGNGPCGYVYSGNSDASSFKVDT